MIKCWSRWQLQWSGCLWRDEGLALDAAAVGGLGRRETGECLVKDDEANGAADGIEEKDIIVEVLID